MTIQAPCVVGLTWTLRDAQNQLIDELTDVTEFYFGGDDLLPKVEEALAGKAVGEELALHLEPEHAFGDFKSELVCFEARNLFPEGLAVGMQFEGLPEGSVTPDMPQAVIYSVTEIYPEHVVLDGNHPLAGMALRLHLKVCSQRPATEEEVQARTLGSSDLVLAPSAGGAALH
jgi:FKBP-type peptidyl-prolyl cis-trans isomerase SlyD